MTLFDLLFLASVLFSLLCLLLMLLAALRRQSAQLRRWTRLLLAYLAAYTLALLLTSLLSPRRIFAPGQRRCWDDWCATALRAIPLPSPAPAPEISAVPSTLETLVSSANPPCASVPEARLWLAEIQITSVAKRIRQRAPDARAELEDQRGARYSPCAAAVPPLQSYFVPPAYSRLPSPQDGDTTPNPVSPRLLAPAATAPHALSDPLNPGESFSVFLPFQLPATRQPAGVVLHHGSFPGILIILDDSAFLHHPALQRFAAPSPNW